MNSNIDMPVHVSVALRPNDIEAVPGLLKEIIQGFEALQTGGDPARHELLLKARTMVQALETPRETMIKHTWAQTGAIAGLSFGVETGLWKLMARNGDKPQKITDLAENIGADPALLARLMRHLGAMGYVIETGSDEYQPTNYTKSMSLSIIGDGYFPMLSCGAPGPIQFHEFARKTGFKNPSDAQNTSLNMATGIKTDFFSFVQSRGYGPHFNHHMGGYRHGRPPWCGEDFFPVQERLINGADQSPGEAFLVDIGGSIGHDLEEFHRHNPKHPGKLILQDLPMVIKDIKTLDKAIIPMEYDFHTEQPCKGARAYYMHSVLHDWPDSVCTSILGRIKDAMKPGYSKLLLNENVIPSTGTWWETSALDMVMLTMFSSKERTKADWYDLVEKMAGLKIEKIWSRGRGVESLIECELP